jgi:hypothetical protein
MVVVAWQQRVLDDSDSGGCQTARVKHAEQWRLLDCDSDIGSYFQQQWWEGLASTGCGCPQG